MPERAFGIVAPLATAAWLDDDKIAIVMIAVATARIVRAQMFRTNMEVPTLIILARGIPRTYLYSIAENATELAARRYVNMWAIDVTELRVIIITITAISQIIGETQLIGARGGYLRLHRI